MLHCAGSVGFACNEPYKPNLHGGPTVAVLGLHKNKQSLFNTVYHSAASLYCWTSSPMGNGLCKHSDAQSPAPAGQASPETPGKAPQPEGQNAGGTAQETLPTDVGADTNKAVTIQDAGGCQQKLAEMRDVLGSGTDLALRAFVDTFKRYKNDIITVFSLAIPFPGGQVVGAALQLAFMACQVMVCKRSCCELAAKVLDYMQFLASLAQKQAFMNPPPELKDLLTQLQQQLTASTEFIAQYNGKNVLSRLMTGISDDALFREHMSALDILFDRIAKATNMACFERISDLWRRQFEEDDRDRRLKEELQATNIESLLKDEDRFNNFVASRFGAENGGIIMMMRKQFEILEAQQNNSGYHTRIENPEMRAFWCTNFRGEEKVSWKTFLMAFPKIFSDDKFSDMVASDLKYNEGMQELLQALMFPSQRHQDVTIEVINKTFQPNANVRAIYENLKRWLEEQRNSAEGQFTMDRPDTLPAISSLQRAIIANLNGPNRLDPQKEIYGREQHVKAIGDKLFPEEPKDPSIRIVFVVGPLGSGKAAVALAAAHQAHTDFKVPGGAYQCEMELDPFHQEKPDNIASAFIANLVEGMTHQRSQCKEDAFKATMASLPKKPMVLVIKHADDLFGQEQVRSRILKILSDMLDRLPQLKIIATLTKFHLDEVKAATKLVGNNGFVQHSIEPRIDNKSAAKMLQALSEAKVLLTDHEAEVIAQKQDNIPMMVHAIGWCLNTELITPKEAMGGEAFAVVDDYQASNVARRVLAQLPDQLDRKFMVLLGVFPSCFDEESAAQVVQFIFKDCTSGVALSKVKACLEKLWRYKLLIKVDNMDGERYNREQQFYEMPVLMRRATLWLLRNDKQSDANLKPPKTDINEMAGNFIKLVADKVYTNTCKTYWTRPYTACKVAAAWRLHVQRALGYIDLPDVDAAEAYKKMLPLLIYVDEYINGTMRDACIMFKGQTDRILEASAFITYAYFCEQDPAGHDSAMDKLEKALGVLNGDDQPWLTALAKRLWAVRMRDKTYKVDQSIIELKEALAIIQKADMKRLEVRLEYIMILAELAGSLDYKKDDPACVDEGETYITDAMRLALGELDEKHPVVTKLWTYQGFYDNTRNRFDQAVHCHTMAMEIRVACLGPTHPDVSQSLNQLGVSYMYAKKYEESEYNFQKALELRRVLYGPKHDSVGRTLQNFGVMYGTRGGQGDYAKGKSLLIEAAQLYVEMEATEKAKKVVNEWEKLGVQDPDLDKWRKDLHMY